MGDINPKYGASANFTITVASLADEAARESTAIDNGTNRYEDVQVGGFLKANATGVDSTGYVNIFAYGSADDGTTYSDGASGADSGHTLGGNAMLLGRVELNANGETAQFGPFSVARVFGGFVPEDWGIIVENQTGAALDATGGSHELHYQGIEMEAA